jgi:hypothetical protein
MPDSYLAQAFIVTLTCIYLFYLGRYVRGRHSIRFFGSHGRTHGGNILALLLSWVVGVIMIETALWQTEILEIIIRDTAGNGCYWLPGFIMGCQNVWQWRDIWQGVIWAASLGWIGIGSGLSIWFWD